MINNNAFLNQNRRQFISKILPACAFSCFGFKNLFGLEQSEKKSGKHKFQKEWGHTYEDAFRWKFGYYIEIMERFADFFGRDKLIEIIKRAVDESNQRSATNDPDFSFVKWIEGGRDMFKNMIVREEIERTDKVYEMKVTECLWYKIFQEKKATDIGYATVCYGDFSSAKAAHPKITLARTKSLMQGHDCCNHRWTWKG